MILYCKCIFFVCKENKSGWKSARIFLLFLFIIWKAGDFGRFSCSVNKPKQDRAQVRRLRLISIWPFYKTDTFPFWLTLFPSHGEQFPLSRTSFLFQTFALLQVFWLMSLYRKTLLKCWCLLPLDMNIGNSSRKFYEKSERFDKILQGNESVTGIIYVKSYFIT